MKNFSFVILGQCVFCAGNATREHCVLLSPTAKSEPILVCDSKECFAKSMEGTHYMFEDIGDEDCAYWVCTLVKNGIPYYGSAYGKLMAQARAEAKMPKGITPTTPNYETTPGAKLARVSCVEKGAL